MRTNYVLIDYENVQPAALATLDHAHFQVLVFVGAHQTKVAFGVAAALQAMGPRARYIKMSGSGPNALDFHIAFYIGDLAARDPEGFFHIISGDTGFDPLIQHLKSRKVRVCRSPDISDIPIVKAAQASSPAERLAVVIANLQQRGNARPRTVQTLSSTIGALFQKQLSDEEVAALVQALHRQGIVSINDTRVSYALPA